MTTRPLHGLTFCGFITLGLLMSAMTAPGQSLDSLRPDHPRLFATLADFEVLRDRRPTDPTLDEQLRAIESRAEALLDEPVLKPKKVGRRMLGVSRNALARITTLSLAWHTTGQARFAERGEAEMLNVVGFPDWNPSHFLDVAEMATAVAIGYDWLHPTLSEDTRTALRDGLMRHALALDPSAWGTNWPQKENNWNSVCFAGMVIAALAIAEHEPAVAEALLASARADNPRGLAAYAPDGVYPEGPGYWVYGTTFQVLMVDALRTALGVDAGDDLGLADAPGFVASGGFIAHAQGPTGMVHNFGDGRARAQFPPALFWIAHEAGRPEWLSYWRHDGWSRAIDGETRLQAFAPIWWARMNRASTDTDPARPAPTDAEPALNWHGQGENPVAYFRESWNDPRAMWLGVKGGRANLSHAHMDAGSFVFEADGVRWAVELNPPGYHKLESEGLKIWNRSQDSDRWKVYSYNNKTHNTLTVADQAMRVDATATLSGFQPFDPGTAQNGTVHVDLAPPLDDPVTSAKRVFEFVGGAERRVHVRDTLRLPPGTEIAWILMTEARVTLGPGETNVTLQQNGQTLAIEAKGTTPGRWAAEPYAIPLGFFDAPRPDVTRLQWRAKADGAGQLDIHIVLRPEGRL